jgi:hypothetical protein
LFSLLAALLQTTPFPKGIHTPPSLSDPYMKMSFSNSVPLGYAASLSLRYRTTTLDSFPQPLAFVELKDH